VHFNADCARTPAPRLRCRERVAPNPLLCPWGQLPKERAQFHIFGALAEFEKEIIRERTRAGLAAARAGGRLSGRPSLVTAEKLAAAQTMRAEKHTMAEISGALGVSRATPYRQLALVVLC